MPVISYLAHFIDFNQFKSNNSYIPKVGLTKIHMHHHIRMMRVYFQFHEIPLNDYLVMAPDGLTDRWMDMEKPISIHLRQVSIE